MTPLQNTRLVDVPMLDWCGCYKGSWKGLISPPAFSHPAKFACGLAGRLLAYGFEAGWWRKGDCLGDPFAGVGCGGVLAAYAGLRWVGVELEPAFHALALENFALHRRRWEAAGDPHPVVILGNSVNFAGLVRGCAAVVTSPPYAGAGEAIGKVNGNKSEHVILAWWEKYRAQGGGYGYEKFRESVRSGRRFGCSEYGTSSGQIGSLPTGDVDAVVTSPPYARSMDSVEDPEARKDRTLGFECRQKVLRYGQNPNTVLSKDPSGLTNERRREIADANPQLGQVREETYWSAVRDVYEQCRLALRPGGVLCVVVKDFVRGGARVSLCDQTLALLCSLGFTPEVRVRAWLTEETREPGLFGGDVVKRTERKSFFRRLAEKRGSPPVDWEEVLVTRAPAASQPGEESLGAP